jgi:hypothetical protein
MAGARWRRTADHHLANDTPSCPPLSHTPTGDSNAPDCIPLAEAEQHTPGSSMSALSAASCSHSGAAAAARPQQQRAPLRCRRAAAAGRVRAALWTPPSRGDPQQPQQQQQPKGYDRPWIQANGQPIMAPRTADMAGDPFGLLLRQRIIFLGGEVDDFGADAIVSQLLLLDQQDATKDIKLFINSPGGWAGALCWEGGGPAFCMLAGGAVP